MIALVFDEPRTCMQALIEVADSKGMTEGSGGGGKVAFLYLISRALSGGGGV